MSDVKMVATRAAYGAALKELGAQRDDFVVLDADLAAATQTGVFKKEFPERFYDCGIAEQNMISIAAGIAATGKKVICSSFAMFAAGRAFEQVRNSIGYPHLNVIIGATHAGISVGEDGATHQCNEDIALMRTIPGMTIINPADETEAKKAVAAALDHNGPVYLRFGRLACPVIFDDDYDFGSVFEEEPICLRVKQASFDQTEGVITAVIENYGNKSEDGNPAITAKYSKEQADYICCVYPDSYYEDVSDELGYSIDYRTLILPQTEVTLSYQVQSYELEYLKEAIEETGGEVWVTFYKDTAEETYCLLEIE